MYSNIRIVLGLISNSGMKVPGSASNTARNRPIVSTEVHGLSMAYWSSPSCGAMSDDAPSPPHIPEGRSMMRHALRALRRLDDRISDCWIGHLIGAAALLVLLFPMSIIVGALQ